MPDHFDALYALCSHPIAQRDQYVASVADPRTYHAAVKDLVARWDSSEFFSRGLTHMKRNSYRNCSSRVAKTALIGDEVVIGRDTAGVSLVVSLVVSA